MINLQFKAKKVSVKGLRDILEHQKSECGLDYTLLQASETDIIIFVYLENDKCPHLSEFNNFKKFNNFKVFKDVSDVIKFNRKKWLDQYKSQIREAETKDNIHIYWIKYYRKDK